ncbi:MULTISPECIES: hypothetical protein [Niastella]|uniref:Uncharacterized protein n=1 Tax=Niastella soli TaxID=2821487 RepID=A0ABS3Z452_9BACT|nr:hypothetical protein [Niastella soli]MBO9204947.1 hypothetical protein [Niastella soli]
MTIKLHTGNQIIDKIDEFIKLGGCIQFKVFDVENIDNSYQTHLEIAKKTLIEISSDWEDHIQKVSKELHKDKGQYFKQIHHFDKLENSGIQISNRDFLGPQFDLTNNKLLIKGVQNFYNIYFYYDTDEDEKNAIDFNKISNQFNFRETDGVSGAFCGAFLEPPYAIKIGSSIFEHGKYFLDFCDLLFSDLANIEVYRWSVDSSNYFDAGKEWWGAHFWTIYNPAKNIYIGAIASTTD